MVPLLIGLRLGVGALAGAEAGLARELLGVNVRPPVESKASGFWARGFAVLRDDAFWKQQAHLLLGWLIAIVALAPFSLGIQMLAIPFYYGSVDGLDMFWRSDIDTLSEALEFVPVGLGAARRRRLSPRPARESSRAALRTACSRERLIGSCVRRPKSAHVACGR